MKNSFLNIQNLGSQSQLLALTPLNDEELMDIQGGMADDPTGITGFVSALTHCALHHLFESAYHCVNSHWR